ncbi:MAG: sulfotransferase domain-containing protein [Alphaproteobacteria bacterium]|nr:sulfotransferase domain-containing protein [Alphaproteobacteria bacterium]
MGGILWLASYPKSGNTWLRAFLHNFMRNPDQPYDINRLMEFTAGESQTVLYRKFDPRPWAEYTRESVARLRPMVHAELTKSFPDTVFAKTHNALLEDLGHPTVNMEATAGAIYVVRNPLDVAVSYAHHLSVSIDETIDLMKTRGAMTIPTEKNVHEMMGSWTQHVESWTGRPNPRLHIVRYEDLLESPFKSFGAITKFLGINAPRDRLDKAIKQSSFKVLKNQEKAKGFIERPAKAEAFFRKGEAGQWRRDLTPEQVKRVVDDHREQMSRFGYVPEEYR